MSPASPALSSSAGDPNSPFERDSSPAQELRHLTSHTALSPQRLSPRNSVHLGTSRLGARSPSGSIPSSPTSIHSSSSTIFERDIETIPALSFSPAVDHSPSTLHAPPNPHHIARAKATEALDASVPSVLDSAVAVLTSSAADDLDALDHVAVVAPTSSVAASLFGPASPLRSQGGSPQRSRSSSPMNRYSGIDAQLEQSLLLHLPSQTGGASSPPSTARPTIHTEKTVTQVPRSISVGTVSSAQSSPSTTTAEHRPSLPTPTVSGSPPLLSPALGTPPSPGSSSAAAAQKRLSFLSYSDLLQSTPASTLSLAQLTTAATSSEPPPHLPSVIGLAAHSVLGSAATSPGSTSPGGGAAAHPHTLFGGSGAGADGRSSAASSVRHVSHSGMRRERDSVLLGGDEGGGEWGREGLGMGLEERLEALMGPAAREGVVGRA